MTDIAILTPAEETSLADCEQVIERGLKTFVEVGSALAAIRDSRLYRATHETFETYCQERWGIRRQRANELITASRMVDEISSTGEVPPSNEAQAVALSRVAEPDRAEVWRQTVEQTDGKPTAAAVRQAAEQRDARALLRRIVDLVAPVNRNASFVDSWIKQLGAYDDELAELTKRTTDAISVLDDLIEGSAR